MIAQLYVGIALSGYRWLILIDLSHVIELKEAFKKLFQWEISSTNRFSVSKLKIYRTKQRDSEDPPSANSTQFPLNESGHLICSSITLFYSTSGDVMYGKVTKWRSIVYMHLWSYYYI